MALRNLVVVVAALAMTAQPSRGEGSPRPGTTDERAVFAELHSVATLQPSAIAVELSRAGGVHVTEAQVREMVTYACSPLFEANDLIRPRLAELRVRPSSGIILPMNQVAAMAASKCPIYMSPVRAALFSADVLTFVGRPTLADVAPPFSSAATHHICEILGKPFAGDAVGAVLEELLAFASRGRVQGGVMLGLAVNVAIASCPQWYPRAEQALLRLAGRAAR